MAVAERKAAGIAMIRSGDVQPPVEGGTAGRVARHILKVISIVDSIFTLINKKEDLLRPRPAEFPILQVKQVGGHVSRSEEHTSELQSLRHLVCRLLLEK